MEKTRSELLVRGVVLATPEAGVGEVVGLLLVVVEERLVEAEALEPAGAVAALAFVLKYINIFSPTMASRQ